MRDNLLISSLVCPLDPQSPSSGYERRSLLPSKEWHICIHATHFGVLYAVQERSDETCRERKSLFLTPWRARARLAQVPWGGEVFRGLILSQSWPPLFLFHRRLGARWVGREGPSSIVMGLAAEVPRASLTFRAKRVFFGLLRLLLLHGNKCFDRGIVKHKGRCVKKHPPCLNNGLTLLCSIISDQMSRLS